MKKIKEFFIRFVSDKKLNSVIMSFLEIPIIVICLIKSKYSVMFWSLLGLAIINMIIVKVGNKLLLKNYTKDFISQFIEKDSEKGGNT